MLKPPVPVTSKTRCVWAPRASQKCRLIKSVDTGTPQLRPRERLPLISTTCLLLRLVSRDPGRSGKPVEVHRPSIGCGSAEPCLGVSPRSSSPVRLGRLVFFFPSPNPKGSECLGSVSLLEYTATKKNRFSDLDPAKPASPKELPKERETARAQGPTSVSPSTPVVLAALGRHCPRPFLQQVQGLSDADRGLHQVLPTPLHRRCSSRRGRDTRPGGREKRRDVDGDVEGGRFGAGVKWLMKGLDMF